MNIKWLGHSAFKLTESTGTSIITDPFDEYVGYPMEKTRCDIVTISHHHHDHDALKNVFGYDTILESVIREEIKGVHISSLKTFHDDAKGSKRGSNLIFKFRIDGVDICHMGDIGEKCSPLIAEAIGTCNVLLIPVGGNYTVNADEAFEYVELLMPDIVIAMHYKTSNTSIDIDDMDNFIDKFDDENVVRINGDSIDVDRTTFDGEVTKLIVFDKDF